jgi:hypothetical protein
MALRPTAMSAIGRWRNDGDWLLAAVGSHDLMHLTRVHGERQIPKVLHADDLGI